MPLPGAENEGSKKPKFEKDFIVLSEFSEQVGPIPIVSKRRSGGGEGSMDYTCNRSMVPQ